MAQGAKTRRAAMCRDGRSTRAAQCSASAPEIMRLYIGIADGSTLASPTACLSARGMDVPVLQNDRLGESFPTVRGTCLYSYGFCSYGPFGGHI